MVYYTEESDSIDMTSKAAVADERAKGKKRDVISLFQSKGLAVITLWCTPRTAAGGEETGEGGGCEMIFSWVWRLCFTSFHIV